MPAEVPILVYIGLLLAASLAGGLLPLAGRWSRSRLALALSFTAGVLLGAAFLHMVPEVTVILGTTTGMPLILGFLLIVSLESFVLVHPCEEDQCEVHHFGVAAFCAISFHALMDGVALGASYSLDSGPLTRAVFFAIVFHKVPAAAGLGTMLLVDGRRRSRIAALVALYSLATPVGAALATLLVGFLNPALLAWGIGLSAGTFVAVATSDLLPQVHSLRERGFATLTAMVIGVLMMWFGRLLHTGLH